MYLFIYPFLHFVYLFIYLFFLSVQLTVYVIRAWEQPIVFPEFSQDRALSSAKLNQTMHANRHPPSQYYLLKS